MPQSQVKTYIRNGKRVRAYTRRGTAGRGQVKPSSPTITREGNTTIIVGARGLDFTPPKHPVQIKPFKVPAELADSTLSTLGHIEPKDFDNAMKAYGRIVGRVNAFMKKAAIWDASKGSKYITSKDARELHRDVEIAQLAANKLRRVDPGWTAGEKAAASAWLDHANGMADAFQKRLEQLGAKGLGLDTTKKNISTKNSKDRDAITKVFGKQGIPSSAGMAVQRAETRAKRIVDAVNPFS